MRISRIVSALCIVMVVAGVPAEAAPRPADVAPPFDSVDTDWFCDVGTIPLPTSRCEASVVADPSTGAASFRIDTIGSGASTARADFSAVRSVKKGSRFILTATLRLDSVTWTNSSGELWALVHLNHHGCDCNAVRFEPVATSSSGSRSGEDVVLSVEISSPSTLSAGSITVGAAAVVDAGGGTQIAPGSLRADVRFTSMQLEIQR